MQASQTLARLCAARSILMIYISTDYVFSGRPGEAPYAVSAPTEPTTAYGQLKLEGETAALSEFAKLPGSEGLGVALRVPVLYGSAEMPSESAVNVLMDTVWQAQKAVEEQGDKAAKIKVDHWAVRYPTCTEDVGRVCHGTNKLQKLQASNPLFYSRTCANPFFFASFPLSPRHRRQVSVRGPVQQFAAHPTVHERGQDDKVRHLPHVW